MVIKLAKRVSRGEVGFVLAKKYVRKDAVKARRRTGRRVSRPTVIKDR